jgi:hypothetical protein
MSPAQVISSAHGDAHSVAGKPGDRVFGADLRAEGFYSAHGYNFKTQFFFDISNRLRVVKLNLQDSTRCHNLADDLEGLYGRPVAGFSNSSEFWHDAKNGNVVRVTQISRTCFIVYSPIDSSGGSGL